MPVKTISIPAKFFADLVGRDAPTGKTCAPVLALRIPQMFYVDHIERDLPAPAIIERTRAHFWIDAESEHLAELLDDADHYADPWGPDGGFGLRNSARATAEAIRQHLKEQTT